MGRKDVIMIDRYSLVTRHNPILKSVDFESPLTVGNGEFAFTADVTGMQTLYKEYKERQVPLCTMSQWGWHSKPAGENQDIYYSLKDLKMTEYDCRGRKVFYAVERKEGNEGIYDWLRHNPHRLNLARIAFIYEGEEVSSTEIGQIDQKLNLYDGILESRFMIHGETAEVVTLCDYHRNGLGFRVRSNALTKGKLKVRITFPYGSPDITASDWEAENRHSTKIMETTETNCLHLWRQLNQNDYYAAIQSETASCITMTKSHTVEIEAFSKLLTFTVLFLEKPDFQPFSMETAKAESTRGWRNFWEHGAAVELYQSKDPRAYELERRLVLSQYLSAIQSCGSMPPQETGLTCNSWYGKFHLEMHLWNCAYLPLWNRNELLKRSFPWYKNRLPQAIENAARNGYQGAKWPKMAAYDGMDSPSVIAVLLIWQQPHIIYMLELTYQSKKERQFLEEYWEVVKETAEYMCDFAVYNSKTGKYDLPSPLIPAQEEHAPRETWNPTFELEYWSFALGLAAAWAERLGINKQGWKKVADNMAVLPQNDELYLAHENCPRTYEKFNRDHPSMLGALGLLPGYGVNKGVMEKSLYKVLECWDYGSMWGWDFAMMAMTAVRLGKPELAIDILMKDTPKNTYVISGNNYQRLRKDLPLYLPGNGSLLLAAALMTAGYKGCKTAFPGFPKDGMWEVKYEGMMPFPY